VARVKLQLDKVPNNCRQKLLEIHRTALVPVYCTPQQFNPVFAHGILGHTNPFANLREFVALCTYTRQLQVSERDRVSVRQIVCVFVRVGCLCTVMVAGFIYEAIQSHTNLSVSNTHTYTSASVHSTMLVRVYTNPSAAICIKS
jgi:hypothetical protein